MQLGLFKPKKLTQGDKIIAAFNSAPDKILSMSYIKHDLYISEGNARMSELRQKGYVFEELGRDNHGFAKHKLIQCPK